MADRLESREADYAPLCPHCEQEVHEVQWRRIRAWSAHEYVFMCPNCRKIIGTTSAVS